jgi:hypothetical protein
LLRTILAVLAGLCAWFVVIFLAGLVLRATWPEFVAATPTMSYTLPMLIARLSIGVVATLAGGAVAARIASQSNAALFAGIVLVVVFVPIHIQLWDKFPIWYHLFFLLSLLPLSILGGRLVASVATTEEAKPAT